jgi:predicted MFS family arabinose efflux permease
MPHENLSTVAVQQQEASASGWLTLLFAAACGLVVANLYYAQPLVGPISAALHISPQLSGLIVTLTQVGYGVGLLLIVPLADILENRRLIITLLTGCAIALATAAFVSHAVTFLIAAACIGLASVAVQVLVPFAAHLAPDATRGRVVGNVMSGLLLGIMLARPVASFITDLFGWHAVFAMSALITAAVAIVLWRVLPPRQPAHRLHYVALVQSMWHLLLTQPMLRRRGLYHACLFAAFSLFWTTAPLLLASSPFHLSQRGIALFALAGVAGAIAAPIAGRQADKGRIRSLTAIALTLAAVSFLIARIATDIATNIATNIAADGSTSALVLLTAAAIILDFAVSANLVVGQRVIFALSPEYRSRLNGIYMAMFFAGGATGSAVGVWAYTHGGWERATWIGFALPVCALLYFLTEQRTRLHSV